jgi:hypothetical protein
MAFGFDVRRDYFFAGADKGRNFWSLSRAKVHARHRRFDD